MIREEMTGPLSCLLLHRLRINLTNIGATLHVETPRGTDVFSPRGEGRLPQGQGPLPERGEDGSHRTDATRAGRPGSATHTHHLAGSISSTRQHHLPGQNTHTPAAHWEAASTTQDQKINTGPPHQTELAFRADEGTPPFPGLACSLVSLPVSGLAII